MVFESVSSGVSSFSNFENKISNNAALLESSIKVIIAHEACQMGGCEVHFVMWNEKIHWIAMFSYLQVLTMITQRSFLKLNSFVLIWGVKIGRDLL